METTLFEVKLNDDRIFRVFCGNSNQKKRFREGMSSIKNKVKETTEISNGIHTVSKWEKHLQHI